MKVVVSNRKNPRCGHSEESKEEKMTLRSHIEVINSITVLINWGNFKYRFNSSSLYLTCIDYWYRAESLQVSCIYSLFYACLPEHAKRFSQSDLGSTLKKKTYHTQNLRMNVSYCLQNLMSLSTHSVGQK